MSEAIKKEAREAILKAVGTGGMSPVIDKYIDKATLAERKRHQTNLDKLAERMADNSHDLEYGCDCEKAVKAEREKCIREVDEALEFASAVSGKAKGMGNVIKILTDLKNNIANSIRPTTIPGGRKVKAINTKEDE